MLSIHIYLLLLRGKRWNEESCSFIRRNQKKLFWRNFLTNPKFQQSTVSIFFREKRMAKSESRLCMTLDTYRDKDGELSRKQGNTLIGTLRSHYGSDFAAGCSELTDLLDQLDEASLTNLARDYEAGKLAQIFPN